MHTLWPLSTSKVVIKPLTCFNFKCCIYFYFMVFLFMECYKYHSSDIKKKLVKELFFPQSFWIISCRYKGTYSLCSTLDLKWTMEGLTNVHAVQEITNELLWLPPLIMGVLGWSWHENCVRVPWESLLLRPRDTKSFRIYSWFRLVLRDFFQ